MISSREDPLFLAHLSSRRQHINSPIIYECGIVRLLKEVVFLRDFIWRQSSVVFYFSLFKPVSLYCCNSNIDEPNIILK